MRADRDERLREAKSRDIWMIAQQLDITGLQRHGHEWVGPCPNCGGTDRFAIDTRKQVFLCRRCEGRGDVVSLVRFVRAMTLPQAIEWLVGPEEELPEAERAARKKRSEENQRKLDARAEQERQDAIKAARRIWNAGHDPEGTPVRGYLAARGIPTALLPMIPRCIRYHPDLPYMARATDGAGWVEIHRGPAMLAAIQKPDGQAQAVHRTWIDLSRPKGKPEITGPDGRPAKVKKTLGSKKGGVIRLVTPPGFDTLVMGEGIETTMTALISGVYPGAAHWCAVDLGNIAGRVRSGKGLKFAGLPDMSDGAAWLPPRGLKRLILVEDGDSDPRDTRAKLEAGARRAMAHVPGLQAQIVPCPAGRDLNDLLMGAGDGA